LRRPDRGAIIGVVRFAIPLALLLACGACKDKPSSAGDPAPGSAADPPSTASGPLSVTFQALPFQQGTRIPTEFTCDGADQSPPLSWTSVGDAKSWVLILDDPDAPGGTFTHWMLYDIPAATTQLPRSSNGIGTPGRNDFGKAGYGGPCPPKGSNHRYFFKLYAENVPTLGLPQGATRAQLDKAMAGHQVATTTLMGTYGR
jgi:Raf kinase inhibitor-like YbhB/YbcL family protein